MSFPTWTHCATYPGAKMGAGVTGEGLGKDVGLGVGAGLGDNVALGVGAGLGDNVALGVGAGVGNKVGANRESFPRPVCGMVSVQGPKRAAYFQPEILTRTPFLGPFIGCA